VNSAKIAAIGFTTGLVVVSALLYSSGSQRPPTAKGDASVVADARTEDGFISIVERARKAYREADTELLQGASRPARAEALCKVLPSAFAVGWMGIVKTLSTNSDGKGILGVSIGDKILLSTRSTGISDGPRDTLIDPRSRLYHAALELKPGQIVTFSGNFFQSDTDCVEETSATLRGSMISPHFAFRFSDIRSAEH
jgi:hypothetical protein